MAATTSIAASSLSPIRRERISSFPAAVSKYHCPALFFLSGIGKGLLSAPTTSTSLPSVCWRQRFMAAIGGYEILEICLVLRGISGKDDVLRSRTEDRDQCVVIAGLRRLHQRFGGIVRRRKCLLRSFSSGGLL